MITLHWLIVAWTIYKPALVEDNGLAPSGTKSLPEPMMAEIYNIICNTTRPQWVNTQTGYPIPFNFYRSAASDRNLRKFYYMHDINQRHHKRFCHDMILIMHTYHVPLLLHAVNPNQMKCNWTTGIFWRIYVCKQSSSHSLDDFMQLT